jgi:hypothetical protein
MSFIKILIVQSLAVIKKEKIIIAPPIILFCCMQLLISFIPVSTPDIKSPPKMIYIGFLLFTSFLELCFRGVTILMATDICLKKEVQMREITKTFFAQLHHMVIGSIILYIPLYFGLQFIIAGGANPADASQSILGLVLVFFIFIPIALMQDFLPIFIFSSKLNFYESIKASAKFIFKNLKKIIVFKAISISLILYSLIASMFFNSIPIFGQAVFQSIILGLGFSFSYVMSVICFYNLRGQNRVVVLLNKEPENKQDQ